MIDEFPIISDFCRLYWGQLGREVYGSLEGALRRLLADAEKLRDNGVSFKRDLMEELIEIDASFERLATEAPHGRCLDFRKAYLFHDDIQLLKTIALSEVSARDS